MKHTTVQILATHMGHHMYVFIPFTILFEATVNVPDFLNIIKNVKIERRLHHYHCWKRGIKRAREREKIPVATVEKPLAILLYPPNPQSFA